ncbi:hypothetical protein QYF61_019672 [Mycteria americana]|uniref:Uncharacterized protein n=1 Tax=Mycteria americana TaxID=33587 RepID=A0AAN7S1C9_MYCAM|nr:hypothetical protein QYF61_019672 [Mycteria americana]
MDLRQALKNKNKALLSTSRLSIKILVKLSSHRAKACQSPSVSHAVTRPPELGPELILILSQLFFAKQPQLPQPLLIRLVLQTLHQLRCPSLDMLQPLNVSLVVGGPKLNTVFEPLWPKPVALHGVVVTQVQDPAIGLVEPHTIGLGPWTQPVQVPLQSLPTLKQINAPTQLGVVCKLKERNSPRRKRMKLSE